MRVIIKPGQVDLFLEARFRKSYELVKQTVKTTTLVASSLTFDLLESLAWFGQGWYIVCLFILVTYVHRKGWFRGKNFKYEQANNVTLEFLLDFFQINEVIGIWIDGREEIYHKNGLE